MNAQTNSILFPPGRIVLGDLYEPQTQDMQGNALVIKSGPNTGKPRTNYFFAVAIPKTRAAWWEEPWGAQVLQIAAAAWPQGQTQNPRFSWKIEDGDSQTPNEAGRKNVDREGHPGHWIVKFGSSFPTKIFDENAAPLIEPGVVKRGYWVEVLGTVTSNENAQKPGLYINHSMVAFRGRDKEIVSGPDPRTVGFGKAALPAHVSMAPVGTTNLPGTPPAAPGMAPPLPQPPAGVSAPVVPPGAPGVPPATTAAPPAAAAPPVAVAPNPGFIAPPAPGVAPAAPVPPVAPPAAPVDPLGAPAGYRMANPAGSRYEAFRQQGWTDAQLLANGHMVKL